MYLKRILGYCRLTTARDALSKKLFAQAGTDTPLLPCPAFLVGGSRMGAPPEPEYVLMNYMKIAGHYDGGQAIDPARWRGEFKRLLERVRREHRVLLLCHDAEELRLAEELDPSVARVLPKDFDEYFQILSRAKSGVFNRLHAAVALAGLGIPSVSIGNDTRLRMLEPLGLPYAYVKNASAERLSETLAGLITKRGAEAERLRELRKNVWEEYRALLRPVLESL